MGRRAIVLILALVVAGIGSYVCWPRRADLRGFEPAAMAWLETAMGRDYYDRTQFGFSPLFGLRWQRPRPRGHSSRRDHGRRQTPRCRSS